MSYLVLARKYRPQNFDDVVRQEHVTRTLSNAISSGRVAHAILFSGPRGTGKTTVARVLAKAMNCKEGPTPTPCNVCRSCKEITAGNAVDVFEIDGASNNGVEHIRELRENIKYTPAHSKYKIYIIDEVHMLSTSAFNALLKTLEEPPAHVMFIFATTEPHKIPITILSRCQRHDFRRIELRDIADHAAKLCVRENIEVDEASLDIISRESGGSMRDALSLLDQVMSCSEGAIVYEKVLEILGVIDRKILFDLSAGILNGDVSDVLDILDNIYDHGHNIKELYSALLEHFRHLSIIKVAKKVSKLVDLPAHEIQLMSEQVKNVPHTFLLQILDMLFKEESNIRFSSDPKLAMEIAFIRLFAAKPALPIDLLIEKLDDLKKGVYEDPPEPISVPQPIYRIPETASGNVGESLPPTPSSPVQSCEQAWEKVIEILSKENPALAAVLGKCQCVMPSEDCFQIDVKGNGFDLKRINIHLPKIKEICCKLFAKPMQVEVRSEASSPDAVIKKKNTESVATGSCAASVGQSRSGSFQG
ncbi:MAG: DNA polymerase III subunit gamma/tau [Desulfobacteraceae bacterium]|nr:DNA polymerase III subunit gamma/tau [Desulfobacteraceae bacterium]